MKTQDNEAKEMTSYFKATIEVFVEAETPDAAFWRFTETLKDLPCWRYPPTHQCPVVKAEPQELCELFDEDDEGLTYPSME